MLLRRVEIRNFRGLRSAVVDFDPTTALVGENSAGKTTLLDAIAICCTGRDDRVRFEVRDFHQAGDQPPAETLDIALTFEETNGEWREQAWAAFGPYVKEADGRRQIRLEVTGTRDPHANGVSGTWRFVTNRPAAAPGGAPGRVAPTEPVAPPPRQPLLRAGPARRRRGGRDRERVRAVGRPCRAAARAADSAWCTTA